MRYTQAETAQLQKEIASMLAKHQIELADSPHAASPFFVPKPETGELRMVVDSAD